VRCAIVGDVEGGFGVYVHVPFCRRRCGYCDFNTYTATELGGGASQAQYARQAIGEIGLLAAAGAGNSAPAPGAPSELAQLTSDSVVTSVFFGGGTPTVLPVEDLVAILDSIAATWPLAPDAEVTTEANPDSVTQESLAELAAGGFTRVSFGMQSAVAHVLRTLDRTHDAERVPLVVQWANAAGLKVSLDLIYGTPGESLGDWRRSVEAALATGVDHISAYALSIHPGTPMFRRVARGDLPAPDDDDEADKYELADQLFQAAGLQWYEISNWARGGISGPNTCRHNLGYWRGSNWLGIGPGAHSHTAGRRWWNVRHPRSYAELLAVGRLPIDGDEVLTADQVRLERIMLGIRLSDGLPIAELEAPTDNVITDLVRQGLVDLVRLGDDNRLRLTPRGRMLADSVILALSD